MLRKKPMYAGSWYPADPEECKNRIKEYLDLGKINLPPDDPQPAVGIVPHAGWYFSGKIACNIISLLARGPKPDLVVIYGVHLPPTAPAFILGGDVWETPLGPLEADMGFAADLQKQVDLAHDAQGRVDDNTIELQLPFIRYFFKDTRILPLGVPPKELAFSIGRKTVDLAREKNMTLRVIGSTDLTHYGDNYGFSPKGRGDSAVKWVTRENDAAMVKAMETMDAKAVIDQAAFRKNACCSGAAAAAICAAKKMDAQKGVSLFYETSHDKIPDHSFVGYAGVIF